MASATRVDWTRFEDLPGAATENFEALGRALVRLHYSRFGTFRATAQMPGIEFHLRLHSDCHLGKAGAWFGWQCRWYTIDRGKSLGKARQEKIAKAIRTTEKSFPELTDWVLWTRHPLTAGDDKWFHGIKSKFRLHTMDASHAEDLLSGDALILRETYFGEWVLRPETLADRRQESVSSIHTRWLPEVHQEVEAERTCRRVLGEAVAWNALLEVAEQLETSSRVMRRGPQPPAKLAAETKAFVDELETLAVTLRDVPQLLTKGDFDLLHQTLEYRPQQLSPELSSLPRRLRALRLSINFDATNGLEYHHRGRRLLDEMHRCLSIRIQAVMANAGGGKTQLAAELTAPRNDRPAGVLLHGRALKSGDSLDDLAKTFVLNGKPMPSFEALVAALDAAGQRSRRRLPIVIDGLNEAQDPRDWKVPLCAADTLLKKYHAVLLVVTLRTGAWRPSDDQWHSRPPTANEEDEAQTVFVRAALPEGTPLVEMNGFGPHNAVVIARYLKHFRINARVNEVPADLLDHPLTLRIFCEVTNPPPHEHEVGPEALPRSLIGLFERYLSRAIERIGSLSPKEFPYSGQDVRRALNKLALQLWNQNSREVEQDVYRNLIGDANRVWDRSLVKMMEQEGLILRVALGNGNYGVIPVYDAIGGYMIANALLAEMGRSEFAAWIRRQDIVVRFSSNQWQELHPMAGDIFKALAATTPRRYQREQLWNLVPGSLKDAALFEATELEGDLIDQATVEEIAKIVRDPTASTAVFDRLFSARAIPKHPFNSQFLDAQLRQMTNTARDLRWTEMIRNAYERAYRGLPRVGEDWEIDRRSRSEADILLARWRMWCLTSTSHEMRLKVTRALYWFGRSDPKALFALTLESLSISDPYVPERMLAASYGVVMDRHGLNRDQVYETTTLKDFALRLFERMFAPEAPNATTHILMREYARRIIEVAQSTNKGLLTDRQVERVQPPFPEDLHSNWSEIELKEDERIPRPSPLGMDFENYTLGRLVPDRGNYDYNHKEYRRVVAQVLWRTHELGWSAEAFGKIDDDISSASFRSRTEDSSRRIDRYGKKYSRIAYLEQAGMRADLGLLTESYSFGSERTSEVDVDPSFPQPPREERLNTKDWLAGRHRTLQAWIARGPVPDTTPLLRRETILAETGPWVMLDGVFTRQDKISGRDLFCFVRTFLVSVKRKSALMRALQKQSMRGRWPPEKPEEMYAFAGEFPWCSTFGIYQKEALRFVTERKVVTVERPQTVVTGPNAFEHAKHALDLLRDGKELPAELKVFFAENVRTKLVPVQEVQEKTTDFSVTIPVCDFSWAGPTIGDERGGGVLLARHIAQALQLRWLPGTHDVADSRGRRATINTTYGRESRADRQEGFYVQEDLLMKYLRQRKEALIWVSWGERGISHHLVDEARRSREEFGETFKVFHTVKALDSGG
ncbi:MAG: hypothetical protein JJU00_03520 [Opitutales bacterium]|nr:hypothetical protein [Opitutales bacterium]